MTKRPRWKKPQPKRASGAQVGQIAVRVHVCAGCGLQNATQKPEKPRQCLACGRMDFISFDSKGEATRWAELLLREKVKMISSIERQVKFPLMAWTPEGPVKVGLYIADFVYFDNESGVQVIEDFKGAITDLASWKLRHMKAQGTPVSVVIQGIHTHG